MNKFRWLGIVGIFLLIYLVYKFGFDKIVTNLASLKYYLLLIFIPSVCTLLASGLAFRRLLAHLGEKVYYWTIIRIKIIGTAFDRLLPLSYIGGDSVQYFHFKEKMPAMNSASALIIDRAINVYGSLIMMFFSAVFLGLKFDVVPLWVEIMLPATILLIIAGYTFLLFKSRKRFFVTAAKFINKINFKKEGLLNLLGKAENLNNNISGFFKTGKNTFLFVLSMHLTGRLMGIIEIWLIMLVMGLGNMPELAFVMAGLTSLLVSVFVIIPGQIGFMEASYGVIFMLLGYDPEIGVSVQLVRRLRVIIWICIGLLLVNLGKDVKRAI